MGKYYYPEDNMRLMLQPDFRKAIEKELPYKGWKPGMPLPSPSEDIGHIITDLTRTFYYISAKTLDLSLWNIDSVLTAVGMFESSAIEELDLSTLNFNNCKTIDNMFYDCQHLRVLDFSNNSFPAMTCCAYWISPNIKILDISGWKGSFVEHYNSGYLSLPFYAKEHPEHLFVNNEEQKAEIIKIYGLKSNQVHAINSNL